MLSKRIQHQLELSFWNITIETLSENKLARRIVREAYSVTSDPDAFQDWLAIGLTCVAGFISGMGVSFLISIVK